MIRYTQTPRNTSSVPFVKCFIYPCLYRDLLTRPMYNHVQWRERYYFPRVYSTLYRVQCALVNCHFACICVCGVYNSICMCATAADGGASGGSCYCYRCYECSPLFVLCTCSVCCYFFTIIFSSSTSQYLSLSLSS